MPEGPVLMAWAHAMQRTVNRREDVEGNSAPVTARLVVYPRCFAYGTTKEYNTCTTFQSASYDAANDMDVPADPIKETHKIPSAMDRRRAQGQPYEYLLGNHRMGPLHVEANGKILAITAGKHMIYVNFGLEATVLRVNREEYATLAAPTQDRPGRNKDGEIADQMRSFLVPDSFKESESKNVDKERFINIMFALECSNGDVWLFIDHSRLMRFEVHSRGTDWSDDDVRLESEMWSCAFDGKYGPSAFQETARPQEALRLWRKQMLREHMSRQAKGGLLTAIADVMCEDMFTFNGFGRHTSMDALHCMGFLPYMPVGLIVADDDLYDIFITGIFVYVRQFRDMKFFKLVAGESTAANPFAFHALSNYYYLNMFVSVFRCQEVKMTAEHWNIFNRKGFFNPYHIIGQDNPNPQPDITTQFKFVSVFAHYRPDHVSSKVARTNAGSDGMARIKKFFSVIVAIPPPSWKVPRWIIRVVGIDIKAEGQRTTLGRAQFALFNANMLNLTKEIKGAPGRRKTYHTGARGRPRKTPPVKKIRKMAQQKHVMEYSQDLLDNIDQSFTNRIDVISNQLPDNFSILHFLKRVDLPSERAPEDEPEEHWQMSVDTPPLSANEQEGMQEEAPEEDTNEMILYPRPSKPEEEIGVGDDNEYTSRDYSMELLPPTPPRGGTRRPAQKRGTSPVKPSTTLETRRKSQSTASRLHDIAVRPRADSPSKRRRVGSIPENPYNRIFKYNQQYDEMLKRRQGPNPRKSWHGMY